MLAHQAIEEGSMVLVFIYLFIYFFTTFVDLLTFFFFFSLKGVFPLRTFIIWEWRWSLSTEFCYRLCACSTTALLKHFLTAQVPWGRTGAWWPLFWWGSQLWDPQRSDIYYLSCVYGLNVFHEKTPCCDLNGSNFVSYPTLMFVPCVWLPILQCF